MTPTHKLIDREDPRCLYCHSECDISSEGTTWLQPSYNVDVLTCRQCSETFEIHWSGDDYEEDKIASFLFTCKDLSVYYSMGVFLLNNHSLLWQKRILTGTRASGASVPAFVVDFSDKEKLYQRLKTFLVFS